MTMNRVIGVTAAAGCAALMLAGCGTTHAPGTGPAAPAPKKTAQPSTERIPATAKVVTLSAASGMVAGAKHPGPVTITNAATVKSLASVVNGLPPVPAGIRHCPADLGQAVQMTFAATRNGPALAVVKAPTGGCEGVSVTVHGTPEPSRDGGSSGVARKVLAIAGVNWPGYGGGTSGTHLPAGVNPGGTMQHTGG